MKIKFRDAEVTVPTGKQESASFVADIIQNRGYVPDSDVRLDWQDMYQMLSPKNRDSVHSPDIRPLLSSAMEIIMREPLEPLMVLSNLFTRVQAKGLETKVLAGAFGSSFEAADVGEGGTYPEGNIQLGGGMQVAQIGKSGIQCSFSDEALRYTTWDILSMTLREMGKALVRHKEKKASLFLNSLGTRLYDNADPASSLFGVTTGRGTDMAANGSLNIDDLFKAVAQGAEEGFPFDVMLVSPLFYMQYLQDPILRNMMMTYGGGTYFQKWSGQVGPRDPWSNGSMGSMGPSQGNRITPMGGASGETPTGVVGREHGMTSTFSLPSYFPWPFRVEVSPLIPFDAESMIGDIYLLSSGNVGMYLVDEEGTQVEWRDENTETVKIKIRERYGYAITNEGQGIGVLKNIKLARNMWDGTVKAITQEVISDIDPTTAIY